MSDKLEGHAWLMVTSSEHAGVLVPCLSPVFQLHLGPRCCCCFPILSLIFLLPDRPTDRPTAPPHFLLPLPLAIKNIYCIFAHNKQSGERPRRRRYRRPWVRMGRRTQLIKKKREQPRDLCFPPAHMEGEEEERDVCFLCDRCVCGVGYASARRGGGWEMRPHFALPSFSPLPLFRHSRKSLLFKALSSSGRARRWRERS